MSRLNILSLTFGGFGTLVGIAGFGFGVWQHSEASRIESLKTSLSYVERYTDRLDNQMSRLATATMGLQWPERAKIEHEAILPAAITWNEDFLVILECAKDERICDRELLCRHFGIRALLMVKMQRELELRGDTKIYYSLTQATRSPVERFVHDCDYRMTDDEMLPLETIERSPPIDTSAGMPLSP